MSLIRFKSNAQLNEETRQQVVDIATQPPQPEVISGLAAHIRRCFDAAKRHRQSAGIDARIVRNLRNRKGEYDPAKLQDIRALGGSEIFMMLTSTKCRAVVSWLADMLLGEGADKPWSVDTTPVPDLPPDIEAKISEVVGQKAVQFIRAGGVVEPGEIEQAVDGLKRELIERVTAKSKEIALRAERKIEDVLVEGGFINALAQFIDDLTVYPSAILKGPVVRRKKKLQWKGDRLLPGDYLCRDYERVDPNKCFPAPHATSFDDGYFIELHELSRRSLDELKGVLGYNAEAISAVLTEYGRGGLREWTVNDQAVQDVKNQNTHGSGAPDQPIHALQFWGSVQGLLLIEWGMDSAMVPDPLAEYDVEAWLIGRHVIRAVINPNPLGKKPYYKTSYEEIPGQFWGNSVADLIVDCQDMCNAAARTLVNNISIASGPQVVINKDRLPDGVKVTNLTPWKLWQTTTDPLGSTAKPIDFFQPDVIVAPLISIFEFFNNLADEYAGMPRYMTGNSNVGGAARTSSGLSMLVNNAGKGIKGVVRNIDLNVLSQVPQDCYTHLCIFDYDPEIVADVRIVARGATYAMAREALQLRRNEFLMTTANPIDLQIMGPAGRAQLLREQARMLQMPVDDIVPDPARQAILEAMQTQMQQEGGGGFGAPPPAMGGGQTLMDGQPVVDHFSPMAQ